MHNKAATLLQCRRPAVPYLTKPVFSKRPTMESEGLYRRRARDSFRNENQPDGQQGNASRTMPG